MGLIKQIIYLIIILTVIYIALFFYLAFFREDLVDLSKTEIFIKTPKLIWELIWNRIY